VEDCASLIEQTSAYSIYPNPTISTLTISTSLNTEAAIEIYNLEGKIIFKSALIGNEKQLDIFYLSSGSYLLKLINASSTSTFRIVKN